MSDVVNLFSGVGWDFATELLGLDVHGIDVEPTVADTRTKLGWSTTTADILTVDAADWAGVDGIIASPPCQSWSRAGKGLGLDDPRGRLVWQPLVWALACRPQWVACEQVPEARGAFELIAHRLRENGYHADVYELSAETFGVPQTRRRVFLAAHRDRAPHRPAPTHQRFRKGRPRVEPTDMLGLLPWVSMAEALGDIAPWVETNQNSELGGGRTERYGRTTEAPSPTLTGNGHLSRLSYRDGHSFGKARSGAEPAFTIPAHVGKDQERYAWSLTRKRGAGMTERHGARPDRSPPEPAFTIDAGNGRSGTRVSWAHDRQSTTVCADPRVSPPVHHDGSQTAGAVPWPDAGADKPIALTEAQGCRLMGFPDGTVDALCGSKQDRWRIIGNAVCPPVGRAVLSTLMEAA